MKHHSYDLCVVGAGPGGSTAATTAAATGARVALVERHKLGGTCLNYGCDPTKTLLHIAHQLEQARHADRDGVQIAGVAADWPAVLARVNRVITELRGGTPAQARDALARQGIDLLCGEAALVSDHEVAVADQTIRAERIIIAAGSQAVVPPIEGLAEAGFITHVQAVALPHLPRRLAIIGGGPIGIEFAQLFQRFGVAVTVLERGDTLLPKDDRELVDQLCTLLSDAGVRLESQVDIRRVQRTGTGKRITFACGGRAEEALEVDELLVAVGFEPALAALHVDAAGIATTPEGITVDATLRTNIPHIWAVGDVTGGYQFTHVAAEQGRLAARNAFAADPQPFDDRAIPWVTYTDPELAHVGKTEEQLRAEGVAYRVARKSLREIARAVAQGRTDGAVKLLVDAQGTILGGHILAAGAGELLALVVLAMRTGLPITALAATIMPYPTLAEAVRWAADTITSHT